MNTQQRRHIALRAARSQLRTLGKPMTVDNAEVVLDEMARTQPELTAAMWWAQASDNQIKLFRKEWRQWT